MKRMKWKGRKNQIGARATNDDQQCHCQRQYQWYVWWYDAAPMQCFLLLVLIMLPIRCRVWCDMIVDVLVENWLLPFLFPFPFSLSISFDLIWFDFFSFLQLQPNRIKAKQIKSHQIKEKGQRKESKGDEIGLTIIHIHDIITIMNQILTLSIISYTQTD